MKKSRLNKIEFSLAKVLSCLVVLVFVTNLFFLSSCESKENVDVMETYYKKNDKQVDDLVASLTSFGMADSEKNKKDSLKMALQAFKEGEFSKSQNILSEYLTRYGEDTSARYYLGLSFMNMGKYADALKQFISVTHDSEFDQKHWLKYNMALCFMRQGDEKSKKEAKRILSGILNDPNFNNNERQAVDGMIALCS